MENLKVWDIESQEYADEIARIEAKANQPSEYHKWDDDAIAWVEDVAHAKDLKVEDIRQERNGIWAYFDNIVHKEALYYDNARLEDLRILGLSLQNAPQTAKEKIKDVTKFDDVVALTLADCIEIPASLSEVVII